MTFEERIVACHRCPSKSFRTLGVFACNFNGRDIVENATAGYCPGGKYGDGPPESAFVALTVRKTRHGMLVEEPPPATIEQAASYGTALVTARRVPLDVSREREATCARCDYARWSRERNAPWCSRCGCSVGGEAVGLLRWLLPTLTQVDENLPKWGCHHPERANGRGWPR